MRMSALRSVLRDRQSSFLSVKVVLAAALMASSAFAQMESATVLGRVTDHSGAVISGADVEVRDVDTNTVATSSTNAEGFYAIRSLRPGRYVISVHKPGFKTVSVTNISLNVQDNLVRNFALQVGAVSESITVTAESGKINTTDGSVSTVVDRQFAENLPMNGRSFQALIQLTPGVVATSSTRSDSGQFSINGQRPSSNYWMVDGVSGNIGVGVTGSPGAAGSGGNGFGGTIGSFSALGGTNSLVSVDAMQEFRIQTSTYAPEFGRTPGGQISIVTRSGANQIHGSIFEYLRNDALDANNWFNTSVVPPLPKAKERQNDFGGTIGGPILKDHTFFFMSYEGLRLRVPQTSLGSVPDIAARQNAVAAMQPYLNAFPLPNGPDNPATGVAQLNASYSNPASLDAYSIRVDQSLKKKWTMFGRYNYSPSEIEQRGANGASTLSVVATSGITTQTGTVGTTWNISPALINDQRFNYSHVNSQGSYRLDNFLGAVPLPTLSFPASFTRDNGQLDLCILFVLQSGPCLNAGANVQNVQQQMNVVDNLSWQRGSHSLKFGIDFRRLSPESTPFQYLQHPVFFSMTAAESGTTFFTQVGSLSKVSLRFSNLGIYAQDTWSVTRRLTLTYGLRWDVDFAPSSANGLNIPAVTGYSLGDLSHLAIAPPGTKPFKTTFTNIAPRLGAAYQVSQDHNLPTVVRGGFGVFYDLASSEAGNALGAAQTVPPFGSTATNFAAVFPLNSVQSQPPAISGAPTLSSLATFNPNLKLPFALEWDVAVEQGIGESQSISASYVGAIGKRLLQTTFLQVAATNPNVKNATFIDNTATSDFHSLQLQFHKRLSGRLQALASYSWSHSIDDGSAGSFGSPSNTGLPGIANQNRGDSDFDIRNTLSAALTYDIPSPRANFLAKVFLHGWSVENLLLARSASPVDLTAAGFFAPFSSGASSNVRPDVVLGQSFYLYGNQYPGGKALNPAAFVKPPNGPISPTCPSGGCPARQGTLGRNVLRGFGATQWDFAIHRDFPIHESLNLQFRAEMFNVLNHPNFGPPKSALGLPGFGLASTTLDQSLNGGASGSNVGGGAFNPLYQIGGPRSIQFALRMVF